MLVLNFASISRGERSFGALSDWYLMLLNLLDEVLGGVSIDAPSGLLRHGIVLF